MSRISTRTALSEWTAPNDLDFECLALCRALNQLPGITTVTSCCGHGEYPFRIWLRARRNRDLVPVVLSFEAKFCGYRGWRVCVGRHDCPKGIHFFIEGPTGAFAEADTIAAQIEQWNANGLR